MNRSLVIALALSTASLPVCAGITMDLGSANLPATPFTVPFFVLDNSSLDIGPAAQANALFVGQGYQVNTINFNYPGTASFSQQFEVATGLPTSGPLTLAGQYGMGVNPGTYQNAASFSAPAPLLPRIAGMLDSSVNGVISFLFAGDINAFGLEILDSGINKDDGLGGPATFTFFDRNGGFIQAILWSTLVDGPVVFRSDRIDIAGVQIAQQDPFGVLYQVLRFGVEVPAPAPLLLLVTGLAGLGLMRRRRVGAAAGSA